MVHPLKVVFTFLKNDIFFKHHQIYVSISGGSKSYSKGKGSTSQKSERFRINRYGKFIIFVE